jgi:hypothetical protein
MEIVRGAWDADRPWPLRNRYKGKTYFELERVGESSRWNTLRARRVLRWWGGDLDEPSARRLVRLVLHRDLAYNAWSPAGAGGTMREKGQP